MIYFTILITTAMHGAAAKRHDVYREGSLAAGLQSTEAEKRSTSLEDALVVDGAGISKLDASSASLLESADMVTSPDQAASDTPALPCQGQFGHLTEKMTVVGLDPPGGCSPGQNQAEVLAHFVGGSGADCRPPVQDAGCYRFVATTYTDGCDLSPLQDPSHTVLGKRHAAGSAPSSLFTKDGVYSKCNTVSLVDMRTVHYIGVGVSDCGQAYCEAPASAKESGSVTSLPSWMLILLASLCLVFFP